MTEKNIKRKLLIVGSFAFLNRDDKKNKIYGGLETSTKILMESDLTKDFEIIPVNSAQASNPPPGTIIRSMLAIKRFFTFLNKLRDKPDAVLILAVGYRLSAIEKGCMAWFCNLLNYPSLIFPRAGGLMDRLTNEPILFKALRFLFNKATIVLCQGAKWENYALNEFGFDKEKVKVINNWTATEEFISIGKQREFNSFEDTPKILYVAWVEEEKGIFELLQACKKLLKADINFNLRIAGNGNALELARAFVKENGLSNHVMFLGWVDPVLLKKNLRESHIYCHPSYYEGLPNSMIEAMSAGLASVVTSVGLIPDYLDNYKHAILVPPRDVDSLETAIRKLINDHSLRKSIAINGHNLVKKSFSPDTSISQLSKCINRVIAEN